MCPVLIRFLPAGHIGLPETAGTESAPEADNIILELKSEA